MAFIKNSFSWYLFIYSANNKLTDEAIKFLVKAPWEKLKSLWLSFNHIGPQGMKIFSEHEWPSLISLHLAGNPIKC